MLSLSMIEVRFLALSAFMGVAPLHHGAEPVPSKNIRFSVEHLDRTVDPKVDFFKFAAGNWIKNNPVPSDKSRWSGFEELQERNWHLIRGIVETSAQAGSSASRREKLVGVFYRSAMDTERINRLGFAPIQDDLRRIDKLSTASDVLRLLGRLHLRDVNAAFSSGVSPDAKNSSIYAFELNQGGLGLPDRDYYLAEGFAKQREAYEKHVARMLKMAGDSEPVALEKARTVLALETALARSSKTRVELRDAEANYHRYPMREWVARFQSAPWRDYFSSVGVPRLESIIVGQPKFFEAFASEMQARPLQEWKNYLRWHVIRTAAPALHEEAERASFEFYGTTLRGQPQQEPRWQRAARVLDGRVGEALGSIYVEKHFPPKARARMNELIEDLRAVFKDRLGKLEWMSTETRAKALAKFERFTQKIGHPEKFKEYRGLVVRADDYLGNLRRASELESKRQLARVGKKVDRSEWHMTPQTVNAYFNPLQNEIVFPAAILQPPFFDLDADDAVNYGAIGVVIGHEITHGYDDEGRKFDADGNLKEWWTKEDAKEFEERAGRLVKQYGDYEALPGLKVNGRLTLGENIADLGGTSIAYEALQRALARDPSKRKLIDGFTPEQRFFLSLSQLWRVNWREAELRRRIVVDPHSPAQFRAVGPHVNLQEFFDAFGIREGAPMWRPVELRAKIW